MDCLILLSITSHMHKHNNNTVNIIIITRCLVCTCFKIIPALTTADMKWNRHGKSCYTARPPKSQCAKQIANPGPGRS
jgi:hypothetical protein